MSLRLVAIAVFVVAASANSQAQEILFTNSAAYLDPTTNPPTPRVTMNGYLLSVVQNGDTYQHVGAVLSNSYSTYNDIANPPANAPGTTFGYAANQPFGSLPSSMSWHADIALPVQSISTDPSNPTFITISFYLVDKNGAPYQNKVFSTYCVMTYISAGKVMTSPAGGPYIVVVPPTGVGMNGTEPKQLQASDKSKTGNRMLPPPTVPGSNLNGFWDVQPMPIACPAMISRYVA
jgi:hypothetical protein